MALTFNERKPWTSVDKHGPGAHGEPGRREERVRSARPFPRRRAVFGGGNTAPLSEDSGELTVSFCGAQWFLSIELTQHPFVVLISSGKLTNPKVSSTESVRCRFLTSSHCSEADAKSG